MTRPALILEVLWGPQQGRKAVVPAGATLTVGRGEAGLSLAHDAALAPVHFEVFWNGRSADLRALGGATLVLDGEERVRGRRDHGAWVRAGGTDFMLSIERHTPPDAPPTARARETATPALEALRGVPGRLYAVLDASRDDRIRVLLRESPLTYRSLYDGALGDALGEVAPYIVELDREGALLDDLVLEGWGRHWGVYISAPPAHDLEAVRRHLRHFLMVELPGGQRGYFRFYDPRVLAAFVPTCTRAEQQQFLGELEFHVVDAHDRALRSFKA